MKKNNWNNFILVTANLVIPAASFYFFNILNHHGPSGDESVAILLYAVGLLVVVLNLFFVFKKRGDGSKKINPLNVIFLLLVFIHAAVNSVMFILVMSLMQL